MAATGQKVLETSMHLADPTKCKKAGTHTPAVSVMRQQQQQRSVQALQSHQQHIGMWGPAAAKAAGRLGKAGQPRQRSVDCWAESTTNSSVFCSSEAVGRSSRQGQAAMDREQPALSSKQMLSELARLRESYGSVLGVFEELLVSERRAR